MYKRHVCVRAGKREEERERRLHSREGQSVQGKCSFGNLFKITVHVQAACVRAVLCVRAGKREKEREREVREQSPNLKTCSPSIPFSTPVCFLSVCVRACGCPLSPAFLALKLSRQDAHSFESRGVYSLFLSLSLCVLLCVRACVHLPSLLPFSLSNYLRHMTILRVTSRFVWKLLQLRAGEASSHESVCLETTTTTGRGGFESRVGLFGNYYNYGPGRECINTS